MSSANLIAIDWGTSNFRAFLLDDAGAILEKKFAKQGILKVRYGNFAQVVKEQISDWLEKFTDIPVIMSGMIGSRQGWSEVAYLQCPVDLTALSQHLKPVHYHNKALKIVPGLMIKKPNKQVDVMRGEETQIMGALQIPEYCNTVFCLPGTHSKWAWLENNKVIDFTTFMTGEVFTVLARHSILGKLMRGTAINLPAFKEGVECAKKSDALLAQLFQVRTQVLAGSLNNHAVHSFLSGVLIGHEIKHALLINPTHTTSVTIIANPRVSHLYATALENYTVKTIIADVDKVTTQGLYYLASLIKP